MAIDQSDSAYVQKVDLFPLNLTNFSDISFPHFLPHNSYTILDVIRTQ